jgi:hypothetical protein
VNAFLRCIVRADILKNVVDGVFKTRAGSVGRFHAFGYQLANFKAIDALLEGFVDLI